MLSVVPRGIEPRFREWKSLVLTDRRWHRAEIGCKGTTKNANMQIFLEKNAFLYKKYAYLQHLANVASGELLKNI